MDLEQGIEMIIFYSILTTFVVSFILLGSWALAKIGKFSLPKSVKQTVPGRHDQPKFFAMAQGVNKVILWSISLTLHEQILRQFSCAERNET
jgi:hypothetical protein